jgi:hypothetical protein
VAASRIEVKVIGGGGGGGTPMTFGFRRLGGITVRPAVGGVRGGRIEVGEKEDVRRRRSLTTKTMEQRPTHRRKLTDDSVKEEARATHYP